MEPTRLKRTIGLTGAVATVVGYVIGASIFILPGELAPSTGPAVFIAYLLGSVPALLSCFVTAQIGSVYPVSGGPYVAASRNLSPFWGFMLVWSLMAGVTVGVALIAYGFADYVNFFVPGLNQRLVAIVTVSVFAVINLRGARLSVGTQAAMAAGFILVLLVFGLGGVFHIDRDNLRPLFPNGLVPVVVAAIPAYFSFIGFSMIADLAGEIEHPARTIPRALGIGFLCIFFFYTLVPIVLVGILPWDTLGQTTAPVATAAATFLPARVTSLITVGALLAAATSLNGIILAVSRDIYALATDGIFPERLAAVNKKHHSPSSAVAVVSLLALVGVSIGAEITDYAVVAVTAIMLVQIISAAAVMVLPTRSPELFSRAEFRLSPWWRVFCAVGLIVYSLAFIALGVAQSPVSGVIFVGLFLVGTTYYQARKASLRRRGLEIDQILGKNAGL